MSQQFLNDIVNIFFLNNLCNNDIITKIDNIKYYVNFIITNFKNHTIKLQNTKLTKTILTNNNKQINISDSSSSSLTFYEFIDTILFETKSKYIQKIDKIDVFCRMLIRIQTIINNISRIKLLKFIYTNYFDILLEIIINNTQKLWFSETEIHKTILGDLFNNNIIIFKTYNQDLSQLILLLLKNKKIKIYIRNWFIDTLNVNIKNKKNNKDTLNNSILSNINNVLLNIFINAQPAKIKNLIQTMDFSLINYKECLLTIYNKDRLDIKFHKKNENDENKLIIYNSENFTFLQYLFYLVLSYNYITTIRLINKIKELTIKKMNLQNSLFELENLDSQLSFVTKSLLLLQKKTIKVVENKINTHLEIVIINLQNNNLQTFTNYLIDLVINKFKNFNNNDDNDKIINNMPVFLIESILTSLSNKTFYKYSTINCHKLINFIYLLLSNDQINPHLKSKLLSITYTYKKQIINTIYWIEPTLINKFHMILYNLYVTFHKMNNTWNYYEKMYIKLDILSFLIYFNENNSMNIPLTYDDKITTQFIYILLEDLIQLNEIIFNYYKSIENDTDLVSLNKEYIAKLLEKNNINYNLIELNCEMLLILLNNRQFKDIFINNKHIIENLTLSLNYTFFNNLPKKLITTYPKLSKHLIDYGENHSIYTLLLKIFTNHNLINSTQFLEYIVNNKYFCITKMRKHFENNSKINSFLLSNNYYILINNIQKIINTQKKDKELQIEYPDEFYDPIMDCIIKNPVFLPSSNTVMERYVIEKHLLTSNLDPFTRDKLTIDLLNKYNETIEIKQKITEFNEKRDKFTKDNI